jgi:hypothetical protein
MIGAAVAGIAGLALLPLGLGRGGLALRWGFTGWAIMAVTGVAGGVWLTRTHGRQGSGFLVALGTCMLARLFASVGGALGAAVRGTDAVWPYLVGLCAGYVPLQLFEVGWFLRLSKVRAREAREAPAGGSTGEAGAGR